jgi:hypothetical protein
VTECANLVAVVHPYTKVLITRLEKKGDFEEARICRMVEMESKGISVSKCFKSHLEARVCTSSCRGVG